MLFTTVKYAKWLMKHGQLAPLHLHTPIVDLQKTILLDRDAVKIWFPIDSVESPPSLSRT